MDKTTKNIIEAGITSAEFDDLFADDFPAEDYLLEFPSQAHRYAHLADLALARSDDFLAEYFLKKSGKPSIVDFCD